MSKIIQVRKFKFYHIGIIYLSNVRESFLRLAIQSVNCLHRMMNLDMRVDVGSVLSYVRAIRTMETRLFSALVLQMTMKSTIPLVRFSTILTIKFPSNFIDARRCLAVWLPTTGLTIPIDFTEYWKQNRSLVSLNCNVNKFLFFNTSRLILVKLKKPAHNNSI